MKDTYMEKGTRKISRGRTVKGLESHVQKAGDCPIENKEPSRFFLFFFPFQRWG